MDPDLEIATKNLGHLGIIASLVKEYGVVDIIDSLLPKDSNNQNLSHGEVVLGMILQGLGFSNQRLYLASEFFSHVAIFELFGRDVRADQFNAWTAGRTLDAIYAYGATRFFMDVASRVIMGRGLLSKLIYIDTTSISVTGKKYKGDGRIELRQGYSKDHRLDLRQLVYLLATTEDGTPILAEGHSGNASDGNIFQDAICSIQETFGDMAADNIFVLDSALYSKKFLLNKAIVSRWITRVPESVKVCRQVVETGYDKEKWEKVSSDFKFIEMRKKYGGKHQRWLLVENRKSRHKEIATLHKKLDRESEGISKKVAKLERQLFLTKPEAIAEAQSLSKRHSNFKFKYDVLAKKKRHTNCKKKIKIGYHVLMRHERNSEKVRLLEEKKGRFVLATNCLSDAEISASEILAAYSSRNNNVEGCFKFIKDRRVNLHQVYLKKESRIEAMLMVMSLILMVNNLGQLRLRDYLETTGLSFPDQMGRPSKRPTFQWAAYVLRHVTKVSVKIGSKVYDEIRGIKTAHETMIRAFGASAIATYHLG